MIEIIIKKSTNIYKILTQFPWMEIVSEWWNSLIIKFLGIFTIPRVEIKVSWHIDDQRHLIVILRFLPVCDVLEPRVDFLVLAHGWLIGTDDGWLICTDDGWLIPSDDGWLIRPDGWLTRTGGWLIRIDGRLIRTDGWLIRIDGWLTRTGGWLIRTDGWLIRADGQL